MELDVLKQQAKETDVGSYFVANYPPFSAWTQKHVSDAQRVLDVPITDPSNAALGLYIHIPFCRKRCKFCYFRVYTDKNSTEVEDYLDALAREVALYADRPCLKDRTFEFVYFGGGTPSYLSNDQLKSLVERIDRHWSWDQAREVTFECEPGTLKKSKLETIKQIGVTRLSLGVEHFDDDILSLNGRAHKSPEIFRAYEWACEVGFDQINIDLIAGMVGDTESKWKETVEKALAMDADSLTVYQMEVPHNSTIAKESKEAGAATPVADWPTKRAWVDYAFDQFEKAGYVVSSGYTVVKPSDSGRFVYRDAIWHGADMVGMGVASFSYVQGVHYQNESQWDDYVGKLRAGKLPLARALPASEHQQLIREMILQLKLGAIDTAYFADKFSTDILKEFAGAFKTLSDGSLLTMADDNIQLTRDGLLRIDALLPFFYETQFQNARYS